MSGNTFGATYWTDGKRDAPSLPDLPRLVKCPHCDAFLWLEDVPKSERKTATEKVPPYKQLGIPDMLRALQLSVASTPSRIRYLRIRLWWTANDQYRDIHGSFMNRTVDKGQHPHDEDLFVNMDVLSALLSDANPEERIMKAELMREMGKFAQVEQLLAFPFSDHLQRVANRIRALASSGITRVERL